MCYTEECRPGLKWHEGEWMMTAYSFGRTIPLIAVFAETIVAFKRSHLWCLFLLERSSLWSKIINHIYLLLNKSSICWANCISGTVGTARAPLPPVSISNAAHVVLVVLRSPSKMPWCLWLRLRCLTPT